MSWLRQYFSGYLTTPQSDMPEFTAPEVTSIGGALVQPESETASVYIVQGEVWLELGSTMKNALQV